MNQPNPDQKPILEDITQQKETYSGEATYLYSSKIRGGVDIAWACEALITSTIFSFALDSHGRIYFRENNRLKSQQLTIETTITELGIKISGHDNFMSSNPGNISNYLLSNAFNLFLSDKKLFNTAFDFPIESARVFMRPIAIRAEDDKEYEFFFPHIRIYNDGTISLSMATAAGFKNLTAREVTEKEVNKSKRNIKSVLCERDLLLACTECQISKIPLRNRISERKAFNIAINSTLSKPKKIDLGDEHLTFFELVNINQLTLTDTARNLLSVAARAIFLGAVRTRINWFSRQYLEQSFGEYWNGKPIIYIESHTGQKESAAENWATQKRLVNSIMTRSHQIEFAQHVNLDYTDMRAFDDYNSFFSESVSLVLSSAQIGSSIEDNESYTFKNLTTDVQVLNEASHFILIYYAYASLDLDRCKTAIDVARLELEIMSFEESLISAHKYGEIAKYIEEVRHGDHLTTIYKLLHKKIETVRKALELDEKISSESATRRITIIFGIIASATLSPELMQPLAKYAGLSSPDESLSKLYGIGASVLVVITALTLTHYIFPIINKFFRFTKR